MKMRFIGIDPGQLGGIAWIDDNGGGPHCTKMPDTERDIWEAIHDLETDEVTSLISNGVVFAVIESVHSMPKQGVVSSFKFGRNYGFLRACLIAAEIPFEEVSPQKWQQVMGCRSRGNKNVTKAKAQQLFPTQKVTHAVADALLLAEYARRTRTL